MSKGRTATGGRTRARARKGTKKIRFGVYILVFSLVALGLGIGLVVYFTQSRQASLETGSQKLMSPSREAEVGQPAPGFSLPNHDGQIHTLNPGDGKNHLLIFYMGNF